MTETEKAKTVEELRAEADRKDLYVLAQRLLLRLDSALETMENFPDFPVTTSQTVSDWETMLKDLIQQVIDDSEGS